MGLAYNSTDKQGLVGVGLAQNEASFYKYPTIIDQMASQGLIKSRAFSLYLDGPDSSSGSIVFGGVDTKK